MNSHTASRLLSHIFDKNASSIYETIREHDTAPSSELDFDEIEERAGMLPKRAQFNIFNSFQKMDSSTVRPKRPSFRDTDHPDLTADSSRRVFPALSGPGRTPPSINPKEDDDNFEVPQSLLFQSEPAPHDQILNRDKYTQNEQAHQKKWTPSPVSTSCNNAEWNVSSEHSVLAEPRFRRNQAQLGLMDPKERALWKWANVENLDNFLHDVYIYFTGKGMYNILLSRILNLLTLVFVIVFSSFLGLCIDYGKINESHSLIEVTIPRCMYSMPAKITFLLWCISLFLAYKLLTYVMDIRRLWDIHNFYAYLLEIPDSDMQTISWQEIVGRLMVLRDANPNTADNVHRRDYTNLSKQRMDAHDIANRLMRRENYLIALCNKDILDLTIPLPFLRHRGGMMTRTMEWTLSQCILDFVFSDQGHFRALFLKDTYRKSLSESLRRRFIFAGVMHLLFSPFIVTYFLLLFLLRNLHDFIKTPARMGLRQYTPLAEWKFREFNELWHLFQMRINMSYPAAEAYVEQFPKEKTAQVARFVSFVASSLLGVLAIGALVDPELVQGFEILPGVNALMCIGILTPIVAVSRGMLQEENAVYDPEWSIRNVIEHTHYMPSSWKDKLHSDEVKRDFMQLYCLKISIFIEEIFSVIFTPFVLWVSLPKCSDRIIDFFREFTVHVDGVGYVCSFAVFNFQQPDRQNTEDLRAEYFASKDNKMLASYLGFMDQYHGSTPGRQFHGKRRQQIVSPTVTPNVGVPSVKCTQKAQQSRTLGKSNIYETQRRINPSLMKSSLLDHHHKGAHTNICGDLIEHQLENDPFICEAQERSYIAELQDDTAGLGGSFVDTNVTLNATMEDEQMASTGAGVLDLLNQFVVAHNGENTGRTGIV
ncbi:autophagy protein Apg9-domain-containing protein [Geopyxis carbonaria]|nr:autophagy protein Apg9-domain-containing protein [Geopyxis carbonaria]